MKISFRVIALFACVSFVALPACRNRPGNGDGNDNGNNDQVPEGVQKAVEDVVTQLESASQAVGGAVDALTNVDQDEDGEFGDCPEIVFVRQDNVTTFALTFEAGCSSEYYDESVSGTISAIFNRNSGSFSATFDEFTVDGQTTDGNLNVTRVAANDVRNWNGTIDISTSGVGSVEGDIAFTINILTDTLTISSATLDVTNADGETRSIEVAGIIIQPVANQSFIPEAGTVTFEVPNDDPEGPDPITVVIEFDANSPFDATVKLTVGENVFGNYDLGAL